MSVWTEHKILGWTGVYQKEVNGHKVEFLGLREKSTSPDLVDSLEDRDRIYVYHKKKRVFNGRFFRPGTSATDVHLVVPEDKKNGNPEMILSYENLKLLFKSNFKLKIYRPLDGNPDYYPEIKNGVETPLVPY